MPVTFDDAEPETINMLNKVLKDWHPALHKAGVVVGIIMARSSTEAPAVKHGGYPASATIRVVSSKDRIKKKYDAELLIDDEAWCNKTEKERLALLDHEMSHLSLIPNKPKKGEESPSLWKYDDRGRPKLKTVKADWNAGDGFRHVIERHGDAAVELQNAYTCYNIAKAAINYASHTTKGNNQE
jgi:hypothetical protein